MIFFQFDFSCLKEKSQYTCPRCNIKYCSLNCYKDEKHASCSELFYKDWVIQELQETKTRPGDKEKMLEMLSRLENGNPEELDSDDDNDDDEEDLESRLKGLDLDDSEAVLNKLTSKEKAEFEKLLKDGHVGNLVEVWTPWWKETRELIEEVDEKGKKSKKQTKSNKPKLLKNIPDINTLIKTKPSPDIRNNMVNVLYSYAFVCRLHNGGHFDCPVNSAEVGIYQKSKFSIPIISLFSIYCKLWLMM
ncbi:hypothetical protein LOTGIDRAFT_138548 [Lottia gigantea]|uniref:HIT-type domain-containing protein n=1 Tax=Lottia gigantea TaxID=225164 RepID=V4AEE0_LOTGI|nr:hypothetical protein LOTGIDRAFT_138548 [Lottia gigantea]ESP02359.1 hypothetical protein LOTGIDRAFT_138548 [Lottia gigantea]